MWLACSGFQGVAVRPSGAPWLLIEICARYAVADYGDDSGVLLGPNVCRDERGVLSGNYAGPRMGRCRCR